MRGGLAVLVLAMLPASISAATNTSTLPLIGVDFAFEQKDKCRGPGVRAGASARLDLEG
jgi:hypothetical protein